jgi:hypothetical protein
MAQERIIPSKNQFGTLQKTASFKSKATLLAVKGGSGMSPIVINPAAGEPGFTHIQSFEGQNFNFSTPDGAENKSRSISEAGYQFGALFENHTYDYDWLFHYAWDEFDEALSTHMSELYRIKDIDVYGVNELLYGGIWVKDGLGSGWLFNYDSENFISNISRWDEDFADHRLNDLEIHLQDGDLLYNTTSVLDATPYSWALNFSQTDFLEWQKEQNDAGYILTDLEIYVDPDDPTYLLFAGLSKENPDNYSWAIGTNLTLSDFVIENNDFVDRGYRPYDYEVISAEGEIRHSAIWIKDGFDHFSWVLNSNDQEEFVNLVESKESNHVYPVLFNILDLDEVNTPIVEKGNQHSLPILYQNEPNPFFQSTHIRYKLRRGSQIQITIYNRIGQKCLDLITAFQPAGAYSIKCENNDMNAGLYLCKLRTPEEESIIKMLKL